MTPTSSKRAASPTPSSSSELPITSGPSNMEPPSLVTVTSPPSSVDSSSSDSSALSSPESPPSKADSPCSAKSPQSPRPVLPKLQTPKTANFPSEITKDLPKSSLPKSPVPSLLQIIKHEEDLKTPITPPTAYTDFLKALSPALSTPAMSSPGTSRSTSFLSSPRSQPSTQPSTASSCLSCTYDPHKAPLTSTTSAPMVPPSPYMRPPHSARTPTALRKLRIPQSPAGFSPASDSPKSSMRSPWDHYTSPRSSMPAPRPVSVKQVVTRTVTYTRTPVTPLEPAPKRKRRKLE